MAFVLDTNFIITLSEIGQIDSLLKLKRGVIVPQTVKTEVDCFKIDLQHVQSNISIKRVTDPEVANFITGLAKGLIGKNFCFVVELKDNYPNITVPNSWKYIPNVIVRPAASSLNNIITNDPNRNLVIEKNEQTRILGQADVHVCAIIVQNQKNSVITMDTSIWMALYIINPKLKDNILPIFSSLKLLFRDEPLTFIDALSMTITKKRYKFTKNLADSAVARICYEDLLNSIDDVLQRYLSDLIEANNWSAEKSNYIQLMTLREQIREVVKKNSSHNGELCFKDDQFINDLKGIRQILSGITSQ